MASYTCKSAEPTQFVLSTTVTDTVTVPATAVDGTGSEGYGAIVYNLDGATSLRVTAGVVGAALDPAGATAVLVPAGKGRFVPIVGASSKDSIDVKVVGSANTYSVERSDKALVGDAPVAPLRAVATVNVAELVDGAGATSSITVYGAALGDYVQVSSSVDLAGIIVTAYVSAADTVAVRFQNETTGTLDLASATVRVRVTK